jgi:6-phospho-3-hexuloisomerase
MTESASEARDAVDLITREVDTVLEQLDFEGVSRAIQLITVSPRVFVVGDGRSGLMARAFAMRLMHLGLVAHVVGETCTPPVKADDLVIAVSGSGTSEIPLHVARSAKAHGAAVLAMTTDPQSPLAALADHVVQIPAATKHRRAGETASVQPLSSLFDQSLLIVCDSIALRLAQRRDIDNDRARAGHANTE